MLFQPNIYRLMCWVAKRRQPNLRG